MNNIMKQLSILYEQELYSDIARVAELAITYCDQKQDIITHIAKYQLYVYSGEAFYNLQQYSFALAAYSNALQIRKYIIKSKSLTELQEGEKSFFNDVDIKYKVYLCCLKLKLLQRAIDVLQSIPGRVRTPKINMALANLYRDTGMERPAIACYKEVIKECPLALDAAENLLKLSIKGIDVNSMILEATIDLGWINTWVRGLAEMQCNEFSNAAATFKSLDAPGLLKGNTSVLVNLARCYKYMCEDVKALNIFQRVLRSDPIFINGRDLYAMLLSHSSNKEHHRDLERLIPDFDTSLWTCEHWNVLGFHAMTTNKFDRAVYFGQQALNLNKKSAEGILLKAEAFLQLKKFPEAVTHYREVTHSNPHRFDGHHGLVQCYIFLGRLREATNIANTACKLMNNSASALTLCASVLLKDPINNVRARNLLDKAIKADPNYIPAVRLLAEHYDSENLYEEAAKVLKRCLEVNPSSRIHQMLGDCFMRLQKDDEAFDQYTSALRMDTQNHRAIEGVNNIGRTSTNQLNANYYMSPEGETSTYSTQAPTVSDHDADVDSDTDQWLNNSRDIINYD